MDVGRQDLPALSASDIEAHSRSARLTDWTLRPSEFKRAVYPSEARQAIPHWIYGPTESLIARRIQFRPSASRRWWIGEPGEAAAWEGSTVTPGRPFIEWDVR